MDISTQVLWQGLVNGVALGWIYILMALGLTLIFGIMRIMQFAHGEIYMLGAYLTYYCVTYLKVPIFLSTALCMAAMFAVGLILERFIFRPLKDNFDAAIVTAVGLTLIFQSTAVVMFGLRRKTLFLAQGSIDIFSMTLPKDRILTMIVAALLSLFLYFFLKKSKYGQAMVASAQDPTGALLQGIGPNKMAALAMATGSALAAAGGALAGALFIISPFMGLPPLIKGVTIIVLGGMGSLPGALLAGMILGLIDGIVPILFGQEVAAILPLLLVISVLLIKPQGFFGHAD